MLQLPLNIQLEDSAKFENFCISNNQQLFSRLQNLYERDDGFIFVWGARESGKTHLAQALCHLFDTKKLAAVYLPLNNPDLVPQILLGMSCMDLVCIDNLDSIVTNESWENALFDLYNQIKLENKKLVIFCSKAPTHLDFGLADLKSRFTSMEIYKLEHVIEENKQEVLIKRAANRGINITQDVANYVLARQSRSLSDLMALLEEIDHLSIRLKRKVTIPLIKEIINKQGMSSPMSPQD